MTKIRKGTVRAKKGDKTGRIWIIDWTDHKDERHQPEFEGTYNQAVVQLEKYKERARNLLLGLKVEVHRLSLKNAILKYVKQMTTWDYKKETIRRYNTAFKPFMRFCGSSNDISSINIRKIEKYERYRLKNVKAETYKSDIRMLKATFAWLRKREYIIKNPFDQYIYKSRKENTKAENVMTIAEILKLLVAALETNINSFEIALFYLATGMRGSEASKRNLFWRNISTGNNCFSYIPKGKMDDTLRIRDMIPIVRAILEIRDDRGEPAPFDYYRQYVSRHMLNPVFETAGLSQFKAHDLRRTAGGHIYLETRDFYAASNFLGHSSVNVTKDHYINLPSMKKYESKLTLSEIFSICLQYTCKKEDKSGQIRVWKQKELLETLKALTLI
ncbi:MAG: site-specific integrase [Candidatus Marinimicrobia bacterium]|nr:site-specific integrase [Candidatus Neomarinimicrobiota bacterium]